MYGNINRPAGFYGPQAPLYPQINQPVVNPSMFAQTAPTVLPGRVIEKFEDIMPGEVPMDKSDALFPQEDGSCIYARRWNDDGTIRTIKFVPSEESAVTPRKESVQEGTNQVNPLMDIADKLDTLLDLLTSPGSSKTKSGVKKNNQNGSENDDKE